MKAYELVMYIPGDEKWSLSKAAKKLNECAQRGFKLAGVETIAGNSFGGRMVWTLEADIGGKDGVYR